MIVTSIHLLKELLTQGEDLEEMLEKAFNAGREFNSKDGVVDIQIVLNMPPHDLSDLEPLYPNFKDYINSLKQEEK